MLFFLSNTTLAFISFFFQLFTDLLINRETKKYRLSERWLSTFSSFRFYNKKNFLGNFLLRKQFLSYWKNVLTLRPIEAFQLNCIIPAFHRVHSAQDRRSIPNFFLALEHFLWRSVRELLADNWRFIWRWLIHVDIHRMHFILSSRLQSRGKSNVKVFRPSFPANYRFYLPISFSADQNQLFNHRNFEFAFNPIFLSCLEKFHRNF